MLQRIGDDHGLLGDFLGHEVLVAGLFDPGCVKLDPRFGPVGAAVLRCVERSRPPRG